MSAKQLTTLLIFIFFCTAVHGQRIEYTEGELQEWNLSTNMQLKVVYYYVPKRLSRNLSELKSSINELIPLSHSEYQHISILDGYDLSNKSIINYKKQRHYEMYDDRLEIINNNTNKKLVIRFSDLQDQDLRVIKLKKYKDVECHSVLEMKNMRFEDHVDGLADFLYTIRYLLYEKPGIDRTSDSIRVADSIQFSSLALKYSKMSEKPAVTEAQRKYIVQANLFNQKREYGKAISLYHKVIEVDQTAYPAAYYNLALLLAQTQRFRPAIYNMKKYLMLVPDAGDARAAKDKIYEWEAELEK